MAAPNLPIILNPNQGIDFTTSDKNLIISGIVDQVDPAKQKITSNYVVTNILVNDSTNNITFTPNASAAQLAWVYQKELTTLGNNSFYIQTQNQSKSKSEIVIFNVNFVLLTEPKINYPNNGDNFNTDISKFNFIGTYDQNASKVILKVNGIENSNIILIEEQLTWTAPNLQLVQGLNEIEIYVEDEIGNQSNSFKQLISYYSGGLQLPPPKITKPTSLGNYEIHENFVNLAGTTDPSTKEIFYSINGNPFIKTKVFYQSGDKDWKIGNIQLLAGINNIIVKATSDQGEESFTTIDINFIPPPDLFISIDSPQEGHDFSTNIEMQNLVGSVSPNADRVLISIRGKAFTETGVIHTPGDEIWSYPNLQLRMEPDAPGNINTILVRAEDKFGNTSETVILNIKLIEDEDSDLIVSPPTGLSTKSFKDSIEVIWAQNPEPEVIGYNVYFSLDTGGGTFGYIKANNNLITESSFEEDIEFPLSSSLTFTGNVKTNIEQNLVERTRFFSFRPEADPEGNAFEQGVPIYFVITAVSFNQSTKTEIESFYSAEISGEPIIIDQTVRDLVPRSFGDILADLITSIKGKDTKIDLHPGSTVRDIFLDPASEELRKLYIVLDFINRAQSFLTLREFDDFDGDNISDLVEDSSRKQLLADALNLTNFEVQELIDDQFDKLAFNFNIKRLEATPSQTELTVYTTVEPSEDIIIQRGATFSVGEGTGVENTVIFEALTQVELRAANATSYYNRQNARWEILVPVQSTTTGSSTNVPAGVITSVLSGVNNASVRSTNDQAAIFGQDEETNSELADRASLALISIDTGTRGGYLKTVQQIPQIRLAKIVSAGHKLMERDFDELRNKHLGGKVDIYIQGDVLYSYEEIFSFSYPQKENELADIVSLELFQFQPKNTELSTFNPIFEVTKITNVTRKLDYDLTNLQIIGGSVIDLDETLDLNQQIGLDRFDVIHITYRYRTSLNYIPKRQPVIEIISVVGDLSGDLGRNYNFKKIDDPLFLGNSVYAQDSVEIFFDNALPLTEVSEILGLTGTEIIDLSNATILDGSIIPGNETYSIDTLTVQSLDESILYQKNIDYEIIEGNFEMPTRIVRIADGNIPDLGGADNVIVKYYTKGSGLPINEVQEVVDEEITLIAENYISTLKVGVFKESLQVFNFDKTKKYVENIDYQIIDGDNITALKIKRLTNGNIPDKSTVKITYKCGENIRVRYSTNELINKAQTEVNEIKHVTADVLVKEAFETGIDISASVVLKAGYDQKIAENAIRTTISQLINQLKIGDKIYESDIISLIEQQTGVSYIKWSSITNRFDKMVRADNSFINRELINTTVVETFEEQLILKKAQPVQLSKSNVFINSIEVTSLDKTIVYTLGVDYNIFYGSTLIAPQIVSTNTGSIKDNATILVTYESGLFGVFSPPIVIISDEVHELINTDFISLNNVNVDETSILVRSSDRAKVYIKDVDYGIISGNEKTAPKIFRFATGSIPKGESALVSYIANSVSNKEIIITDEPHQMFASNPESLINSNVQENTISIKLNSKVLTLDQDYAIISGTSTIPPQVYAIPGGEIKSGDIILISYTTSPFGINEKDKVISYISRDPVLQFKTQNNGGQKINIINESLTSTPRIPAGNNYKMNPVFIFEDKKPLTMVDSEEIVDTAPGQGYIREDRRIIITTLSGLIEDRPEDHIYHVNYVVLGETGSKDIITNNLEYPKLGTLSLTFTEEEDDTFNNSGFLGNR